MQQNSEPNSTFIPSQSGDFYSFDEMYFSPLRKQEEWSFRNIKLFNPELFSFFLMRCVLYHKYFGKNIQVRDLSNNLRSGISKSKTLQRGIFFDSDEFIPELISEENSDKRENFSLQNFVEQETSFLNLFFGKFATVTTGGGIIKDRSDTKEILQGLSDQLAIKENPGELYFRSNYNSYYFNTSDKSPKFFVQEKVAGEIDFVFFLFKTERIEKKLPVQIQFS
ncbi:MAG: hypothetical protein K8R21_14510 [Leptospira sp.]|nr:hypothetical protein [Leptospira sp.]